MPIAIQSVAQFVTGDNDCAVFPSSVPVGTQIVTLPLRPWMRLDTQTSLSRCLQHDNIAIASPG